MKEKNMPSNKFFATNSDKRLHRWGFKDSGFELIEEKSVTFSGNRYEVSGTVMPDFIPYIDQKEKQFLIQHLSSLLHNYICL